VTARRAKVLFQDGAESGAAGFVDV